MEMTTEKDLLLVLGILEQYFAVEESIDCLSATEAITISSAIRKIPLIIDASKYSLGLRATDEDFKFIRKALAIEPADRPMTPKQAIKDIAELNEKISKLEKEHKAHDDEIEYLTQVIIDLGVKYGIACPFPPRPKKS